MSVTPGVLALAKAQATQVQQFLLLICAPKGRKNDRPFQRPNKNKDGESR
jgi:hypothetical protein